MFFPATGSLWVVIIACLAFATLTAVADDAKYDPAGEVVKVLTKMDVRPDDSPQLGRSPYRNNVSDARNIPSEWDVTTGWNIKWSTKLGSQTFSSPVVANGKVFIGSNNARGNVKRYSPQVDLGVLLCFNAENGEFLWQHSNRKLEIGRDHDWDQLGVCSSAYVDGKRLWYVNNRDEICCLDTEGFLDGKNDGPVLDEPNENLDEADIIWKLDLVERFGASPHLASVCSVTVMGDTLFCTTSNGVSRDHKLMTNPEAPSFVALDKNTGRVLWTDNSPGANVMHGQCASPSCGVLGGVLQVLFAGGDGWLYSFDPEGSDGNSKLLWKFDCNPKTSKYTLERSTRHPLLATPVIYDGLVYIGVGEDPEHGEGPGHLWCIDPTKRGDVSPTLVYNKRDPKVPIPYKRIQACDPNKGDFEQPNGNSALVWHYVGSNPKNFEQTMHRTLASVAIKDDLLFVCDESGLFHCVDAKSGREYWTHDILSATWSPALIVSDNVYLPDQDGKVWIFKLSKDKKLISQQDLGGPMYFSSPVVAGGVLYIPTCNTLYAIAERSTLKPITKDGSGDEKGP